MGEKLILLALSFNHTIWPLVLLCNVTPPSPFYRPVKRFVEVDFPGVTARKCFMIKRHRQLLAAVASGEEEEVRLNRTDLHSPR